MVWSYLPEDGGGGGGRSPINVKKGARPFSSTFHLHNLMNSIHCNAIPSAGGTSNDSLS